MKKVTEDDLVVGTRIKIGEKYAAEIGRFDSGEEIELIEGYFERYNGLYDVQETAPSIHNGLDYDSIYHLFGNDLEDFMDCQIIS